MEASDPSDIEFKVIIIKMLDNMKKDTETIKKDQSEIMTTICEIIHWKE